jgi:phosphoglycolate phosphatase-like HAD superfamily hydrolase
MKLTINGYDNYIRKDQINEIQEVDTVIFDCDGVLIDVTEAYGRAVGETVSFILSLFLGVQFPTSMIDNDVIFAFKKTGGFNNDWALTYAIIMYVLASLPTEEIKKVEEIAEKSLKYGDLENRLEYVKNSRKKVDVTFSNIKNELLVFAETLDETGSVRVNQVLKNVGEELKTFLGFPGMVGYGLVPTLFELLFDGAELFTETFKKTPLFKTKAGLVEEGKIIIKNDTLDNLSETIGTKNFGIASGSIENTAKHVLGSLKDQFKEEAQVWMDDVLLYMKENPESDLHKPNPFSLLKAAEAFEPYKKVLYVGDTMADLYTVRNTQKVDQRYIFMGVYQHGFPNDSIINLFIENRAAIIAANVNMLPLILNHLRE